MNAKRTPIVVFNMGFETLKNLFFIILILIKVKLWNKI
jgi:hypothetical protein